LANVLISREKK